MQKFDLYDLEIDLHEQCNLKCLHCSHSSPHFSNKDPKYSLKQFKEDINFLSKIANIHSLRLVGGEPLLNKELLEYVIFLRQNKIAKEVKLFTNGLLLRTVNPEVFNNLDSLKISVYSNLPKEKIDAIKSNINYVKSIAPALDIVANEIEYFLKSNLIEENTNSDLVKQIYNKCYYAYEHRGVALFNGRLYKCFASRKKHKLLEAHNKLNEVTKDILDPSKIDSIALNENLDSSALSRFLEKGEPLEACRWCLGTCGKMVKHEQLKSVDQDIATVEDIDFEAGEIYISNNILSWDRFYKKMGDLVHNKFFKLDHLKHYIKMFKFKSFL